ncbi:hypothetical protein BDQ12DRAFT_168524 [Crucibulum laeve]|uniref:Protein kinase domain-containing protein n=1 Tax=Crucibulum laeve TaxID=68775 RepID=A0A5C3MCL9_9AGAR|nr:hypothetical protein BDQ12DRAFT_168524 [Crucibulum laeve]
MVLNGEGTSASPSATGRQPCICEILVDDSYTDPTITCQTCRRIYHALCCEIEAPPPDFANWKCRGCKKRKKPADKERAKKLQKERTERIQQDQLEIEAINKELDPVLFEGFPGYEDSVRLVRAMFELIHRLYVNTEVKSECKKLANRSLGLLIAHHNNDMEGGERLKETILPLFEKIHEELIKRASWEIVKSRNKEADTMDVMVELLSLVNEQTNMLEVAQKTPVLQFTTLPDDIPQIEDEIQPKSTTFADHNSEQRQYALQHAYLPLIHDSISLGEDSPKTSGYTSQSKYMASTLTAPLELRPAMPPLHKLLEETVHSQANKHSFDTGKIPKAPPAVGEHQINTHYLLEKSLSTRLQSSSQVYKHLSELIGSKGTDSDMAAENLDHLDQQIESVSMIIALARSQQCIELLQCSPYMQLSNPEIRDAIEKDEYFIFQSLADIITLESKRKDILQLQGDAQGFIDLIQMALDRNKLQDAELQRIALRLMMKMCEMYNLLPSSLFIEGVELRERDPIDGGGFADIYRGSYRGKDVALKRIRIFQDRQKIHKNFCREALIWRHLRHPHVLPFIGVDSSTFQPFLCMISPWMQHGTIMKHLEENGSMNISNRLFEVALGLEYLHSQNIVHGDLRGGNILINDEWQACLAGFGLTIVSEVTFTSHTHGSIRWMAPELHYPKLFNLFRSVRTSASDTYSFACVCLEVNFILNFLQ